MSTEIAPATARITSESKESASVGAPAPARSATPATTGEVASGRLMSIDALRGFDMFWIIGAGFLVEGLRKISDVGVLGFVAKQLEHKAWEGLAFEDLIFPLFVFIAGVSIVFSLPKAIASGGKSAVVKRLFWRSLLLYMFGVLIYGGMANNWPGIRLLGVLQRIAICYFFAGTLFCIFRWRGLAVTCAVVLVGYWLALKLIPVPGIGTGNYAEGKNLADYIDSVYLPGRKWDKTHDPEGLLSTFPAICTCLLGVLAGLFLKRSDIPDTKKAQWLIGAGVAAIALGYAWSFDFPIIKKIWTSSYVLVAGGYSAIMLGVFFQIVDVWKYQRWAMPFVWIGTNSIFIYLIHELIKFDKLALRFVGGDVARALGIYSDLATAIVAMALTLWLVHFLYVRKLFIRI